MREIKFRAWNEELKEVSAAYYDEDDKCWWVCDGNIDVWDDWVRTSFVNQYTGLKDKNGKDIFEHDIVKVKIIYYADCSKEEILSTEEITGLVGFEAYAFSITTDEWFKPFLYLLDSEIEVIGNLYENPELLNKCRILNGGKEYEKL